MPATTTKAATKKRAVKKKVTTAAAKKKAVKKDLSASYNEYKEFEGRQYSGMSVGRSHKWYYDKGEWKETKITPDLWRFPIQSPNAGLGVRRRDPVYPLGPDSTGTSWRINT